MKKISDGKKCMICLALVLIMGFLLFYTYTGDGRKNEHEGIIRLHVIANSDTVGDQALKLKVRDAVIEYLQKQDDLHTVDDTREYLEANLGSLEKISEGIIAANGRDYSAHAKLGVRYIPEKTYGDITFPAGNYEALNITLGDGKGENWWCVLFPPLCLLDEGTESDVAGDDAKDAPSAKSAGLDKSSGNGTADASGGSDSLTDEQRLHLKWKIAELLGETK